LLSLVRTKKEKNRKKKENGNGVLCSRRDLRVLWLLDDDSRCAFSLRWVLRDSTPTNRGYVSVPLHPSTLNFSLVCERERVVVGWSEWMWGVLPVAKIDASNEGLIEHDL